MAHIGDILKEMKSEIKLQFLQESVIKIQDKKRTCDTEITFATNETTANDFYSNDDKVGVVLWVSRSEYNEAIQNINGLDKDKS